MGLLRLPDGACRFLYRPFPRPSLALNPSPKNSGRSQTTRSGHPSRHRKTLAMFITLRSAGQGSGKQKETAAGGMEQVAQRIAAHTRPGERVRSLRRVACLECQAKKVREHVTRRSRKFPTWPTTVLTRFVASLHRKHAGEMRSIVSSRRIAPPRPQMRRAHQDPHGPTQGPAPGTALPALQAVEWVKQIPYHSPPSRWRQPTQGSRHLHR